MSADDEFAAAAGPSLTMPATETGSDVRLLRPAAACPRCGARPAMRVEPVFALFLKHAPLSASDRVATYQCQRRGCGAVYDITASAFQRASVGNARAGA